MKKLNRRAQQFVFVLILFTIYCSQNIVTAQGSLDKPLQSIDKQNDDVPIVPKTCGSYTIDKAALKQAIDFENSSSNKTQISSYTIRVYFHICRNDNGSNAAATLEQVKSEFNELIADFAPMNICFVSMGNHFIDNTTLNNNPTANFVSAFTLSGCLNIFYHYNMPGVGGSAWAIPNTFCSIDRSNIGAAHTTSHEVGHCLGLLHTFEPVNGFEKINGTNSSTAGDQITDTPADPYVYNGQGCFSTSGCSYNGNCTDPNGATNFNPPYTNTMAYWPVTFGNFCVPNPVFTSGQFTRVNSFLSTNINLTPLWTPWQNLYYNGTSYTSGIHWDVATDNIGNTGSLSITGSAIATLGANSIILGPGFIATPSSLGLVLIRPTACSAGNGIPKYNNNLFDDQVEANEMNLYPNPASDVISINIPSLNAASTFNIYNSTMQLIKTLNFESGIENTISTADLPPGIYFIDAQSDNQHWRQKFIINR
ncbi:MAG TPA: zinc-dependent metalloprotease [Bacteroidia bacterium]|nr:zinc-dependent metalloprotease [Bacteroidia bacterium]